MKQPASLAMPYLLAILVWVPSESAAHVVHGEGVSFAQGFVHPISGLDHVIAMVAVGLWGAQLGAPALWLLPLTFPVIMSIGGFLGLIGVPLAGSETVIALSGLCLGGAVLMQLRPPLWLAGLLVGIFGLYHGYAHGAEFPREGDALLYSIGFVLATGLLHASGVTVGLLHKWSWGRIVLRGAGAVILGGGTYFLWGALA